MASTDLAQWLLMGLSSGPISSARSFPALSCWPSTAAMYSAVGAALCLVHQAPPGFHASGTCLCIPCGVQAIRNHLCIRARHPMPRGRGGRSPSGICLQASYQVEPRPEAHSNVAQTMLYTRLPASMPSAGSYRKPICDHIFLSYSLASSGWVATEYSWGCSAMTRNRRTENSGAISTSVKDACRSRPSVSQEWSSSRDESTQVAKAVALRSRAASSALRSFLACASACRRALSSADEWSSTLPTRSWMGSKSVSILTVVRLPALSCSTRRTQNPAARAAEDSKLSDESHAASNILASPTMIRLSSGRVKATLTLLALSMKPQECCGLERVVLKMTMSASPPCVESMVSTRNSPASHSATHR